MYSPGCGGSIGWNGSSFENQWLSPGCRISDRPMA